VAPEALADAPAALDPLAALVRRTDPADAGAQNNLGVLLHRRGRPDAALRAFARALALDPAMRLARRNFVAAAEQETGARQEAELRSRLRLDGADLDARRELARLLSALGRHEAARGELEILAALAPDAPGVHVERARVEQAAGDIDAAASALERARALAPGSATVRTLLAHVSYHAGDHGGALAHVCEALRLAPDHADAHLLHGFILGELGRAEEGAVARARAVALDPALGRAGANLALPHVPRPAEAPAAVAEPPEAHLALAAAFRHKGYHDEALREYRRAAALGAPEPVIVRALGELQLLLGAPDAACAAWARATVLSPEDPSAWLGRAGAAQLAGRPDEARAAYERVLALSSEGELVAAFAHNNLGVLCWAAGDLAGAARAFERAAGAPTVTAPRLNLAAARAALGDAVGALAIARDVARAAPSCSGGWTLLGALLAEAGRPGEARGAFARALDLAPHDVSARYGLAFAAAALGEHDLARRETERALAQSPVVPGRRLHLVLDLGGPTEFAVDAPSLMPAAAVVTGFALDDAGADALVADLLSPTAEPDPAEPTDAPEADPFAVADEHLAHGDVERTQAAIGRALARGADRAAGLVRLGALFARRGLHGEALERFAEARALAPTLRASVMGEVRALRELGRMRQACDLGERLAVTWAYDDEALALAALARADAGDHEGAYVLLARASVAARAAGAWRDVATAWRALGDPRAALAAQRRVAELCPTDPAERLALAYAHRDAGDVESAERLLRALAADAPALADAAIALASLRAEAGAPREAVPLLAAVAARDPWHVDALALLGAALADAGRPHDAAIAVARARRLDPEHALAIAVEGDCHLAAGERARAVACWRDARALEPVGAGARRARTALLALGETP
jgi:tetratricopeptide (TPR) repeat protein